MPRARIICQNCGQQLSYLELAPYWTVRATCPSCRAVTVARLNPAGEVCLTLEEPSREAPAAPAKRARAAGGSPRPENREAG